MSSSLPTQLLAVVLCLATPALASPHLLDASDLAPPRIQLADYHPAAPVGSAPSPGYVPAPTPVVTGASVNFFLLGLGLVGAGLVLGGAGFAVLYGCRSGTACFGETTTVVGWVLAAPGVLPLVVGLVMIWLSSKTSGRVEAPTSSPLSQWAFGLVPLPGGAMAGAGAHF